jgi:arylsulfatase A-like enzyme
MKLAMRAAVVTAVVGAILTVTTPATRAQEHHGRGRIVILMVWDGLRPDFVSERDTPNLFAFAREGVRFDRHHALFPTVTMVNAASLATGASPAMTGIFGDDMLFAPALADKGAALNDPALKPAASGVVMIENSDLLVALNGADAFAGRLLGLDTITQEVEREGGYTAVIGKRGPTFLFDDRVAAITDGHDSLFQPHKDYLFVTDDMADPPDQAAQLLGALPARTTTGVSDRERDEYFAKLVAERALPAAKRAADAGRPALIVFWQHNPDLTQHRAGLGTAENFAALAACDENLARVRAAVDAQGAAGITDLIIVSDHGFATIQMRVALDALLVSAGLKKSRDSTDVVIAANGGTDLVYLSRDAFATAEARREELQKIVNFCEAQDWCGPIFSRETAIPEPGKRAPKPYLGWIDGTFAEAAAGLLNTARSPDLVISFRETADADNKKLTGQFKAAFAIGAQGQVSVKNKSEDLVRPVKGIMYADTGPGDAYTTGMGMHGAAGAREIHNFAAAAGPDFKRGFVDRNPTSNADVAPTITEILGALPNVGPAGVYATGREMTEALARQSQYVGAAHALTMRSDLWLQGVEVMGTLKFTKLSDRLYLDDSSVERKPLGSSP